MTPTSYLPFVDFPHYLAVTRDVAFHAETVSYAHVDMVQVNHRYNLNDEGDAYDRLQEIVYRHLLRVLAEAGYQLQDLCSFFFHGLPSTTEATRCDLLGLSLLSRCRLGSVVTRGVPWHPAGSSSPSLRN